MAICPLRGLCLLARSQLASCLRSGSGSVRARFRAAAPLLALPVPRSPRSPRSSSSLPSALPVPRFVPRAPLGSSVEGRETEGPTGRHENGHVRCTGTFLCILCTESRSPASHRLDAQVLQMTQGLIRSTPGMAHEPSTQLPPLPCLTLFPPRSSEHPPPPEPSRRNAEPTMALLASLPRTI